MDHEIFNVETLGEAMRPMKLKKTFVHGDAFRLSREERDHIAGHALDSIDTCAEALVDCIQEGEGFAQEASSEARQIAALSNLLGDIGWERSEARPLGEGYLLGELFPVAQLRPWLEKWQRRDSMVELRANRRVEMNHPPSADRELRDQLAEVRIKLGTGAILLTRIEKWMASREN